MMTSNFLDIRIYLSFMILFCCGGLTWPHIQKRTLPQALTITFPIFLPWYPLYIQSVHSERIFSALFSFRSHTCLGSYFILKF